VWVLSHNTATTQRHAQLRRDAEWIRYRDATVDSVSTELPTHLTVCGEVLYYCSLIIAGLELLILAMVSV